MNQTTKLELIYLIELDGNEKLKWNDIIKGSYGLLIY